MQTFFTAERKKAIFHYDIIGICFWLHVFHILCICSFINCYDTVTVICKIGAWNLNLNTSNPHCLFELKYFQNIQFLLVITKNNYLPCPNVIVVQGLEGPVQLDSGCLQLHSGCLQLDVVPPASWMTACFSATSSCDHT